MQRNVSKIILKYYLPAILWMCIIFYFSSVPDLRYQTQSLSLEIILRKAAHLAEYFILAWLVFRIFYCGHKKNFSRSYWLAFVSASLYAVSDEFHQTLVPGRSGRIIDVAYDIVSVLIILQIINIKLSKKLIKRKIFALVIFAAALLGIEANMIQEGEIKKEESLEQMQPNKDNLEKNSSINSPQEYAEINPESKPDGDNNLENQVGKQGSDIPASIKINVPFASQAPLGVWDGYHEEACEEASLVMLKYYLDGKKLTPDMAEQEIQKMIAFEIKNYGDYKDTTAQKNVDLFNAFYGAPKNGKKLKVVYDFPKEDIEKYLAKGEPIIVPAAGRLLGNPNFKAPGPLYHNLILVGYKGNTIITNDPGTRKGESYTYDVNVLYNAIHDFPGKPGDIQKGRKAMIVLD